MYKFAVLFALIACSFAAPEPKPGFVPAAVAVPHGVPVATSYANTYKVSYNSPFVAAPVASAPLAYAATVAHVAPVAHAAVLTHHHAPIVAAPAPLLVH